MLKNGLGQILLVEAPKANRFFDPFCGSSSVAWFIAENTDRQVIAGDLQKFSTDLANSILLRDEPASDSEYQIIKRWINKAIKIYQQNNL